MNTVSLKQLPSLLHQYPFPSVTLPKRMSWTSSSVKLFRSCKRKWFWKYILRLQSKYSSKDLIIGKAFHAALGEWYKGKRAAMQKITSRYQKELEDTLANSGQWFDQDDVDKFETLVSTYGGMMMGYAEVYEHDRQEWNIVRDSIEKVFKVNCGEYDYEGKIDLVTSSGGKNKLVEHKTAAFIEPGYIDRLSLDLQIRGYVFGASHPEGLGLKINKVLYDVVRKCKLRRKSNEDQDSFNRRIADDYICRPDFYFYREDLLFNRSDIDAFRFEVEQVHREYKAIVREGDFSFLLTDDFDALNPRHWNPNDGNCNAYFKLCEYHRLCTTGLDLGTGSSYQQAEDMHVELAEEV